jgi:hypothetical protein
MVIIIMPIKLIIKIMIINQFLTVNSQKSNVNIITRKMTKQIIIIIILGKEIKPVISHNEDTVISIILPAQGKHVI